MNRCVSFSLLVLLFELGACGSTPAATPVPTAAPPVPTAAPLAPTAPPTTLTTRPKSLRMEIPVPPDISDIPRLMAVESLQAQGYTIEPLSLNDTTVTVQAMEHGDLDVASISSSPGWSAIQKGASIITIMDDSALSSLVAAKKGIEQCADLDGKRVGVASLKGSNAAMLTSYISRHCPAAKPDYLVIPGKGGRLVALLAGDLDAAVVDLSDFITVKPDRQGDVHALSVFSEEFPSLTSLSFFARRGLAEQYPETVKDFIRAVLAARRRIQDPQVLSAELVKRMGLDPDTARTTAKNYLDRKMWDVNGGYTLDSVQQNIDFLVKAGGLGPGLKAKDAADLSYLNAVLDEIGRK